MEKNVRRDVLSIRAVSKMDAGVYTGFALNMGNEDASGTGVKSSPAEIRVIGECLIFDCNEIKKYCVYNFKQQNFEKLATLFINSHYP